MTRWMVTVWGWSMVDAAFGGSGQFIVEQSYHRWKWQADLRQFALMMTPCLVGLIWSEVEAVEWPAKARKKAPRRGLISRV